MLCCKQNQGGENYFCYLFSIFSFSISLVMIREFSSNISQQLLDLEF